MAKSSLESTTEVIVNLTGKIVVRVLYVDDGSSFLKIAKSRLEAKGQFEVDAAPSVEEAVGKMREGTYDVVVLDYQMPGRNGLEFLRDLRRRGDSVPFVMFIGARAISLFSDFHGVKAINECQGLMVLADSLLRQLFYNLVDNSLKYGQKISQIRVRFENLNDEQLKLIYEDDGVGIAVDEKPKLFREGYGRGTGYGLYLIKKMVEIYGWTIEETSEPGKGVQFTMTMPQQHENRDSFQIAKRS